MRNFFFVFILFFTISSSFAQTGFNVAYFSQSVPEWESTVFGTRSNENLLSSGYSAELDVRIASLANYRVDFYPTLSYNASKYDSGALDFDSKTFNFDLKQYEFSIKTNIYVLSMEADCDCPTFSRDAGILEKGFFIQIAPGLSYFQSEAIGTIFDPISSIIEPTLISEGSGLNFKLGLGMGVDIGISDYITISPIIKYNRYFNANWEGLSDKIAIFNQSDVSTGNDKTGISQFYGGVRLGIKFKR